MSCSHVEGTTCWGCAQPWAEGAALAASMGAAEGGRDTLLLLHERSMPKPGLGMVLWFHVAGAHQQGTRLCHPGWRAVSTANAWGAAGQAEPHKVGAHVSLLSLGPVWGWSRPMAMGKLEEGRRHLKPRGARAPISKAEVRDLICICSVS